MRFPELNLGGISAGKPANAVRWLGAWVTVFLLACSRDKDLGGRPVLRQISLGQTDCRKTPTCAAGRGLLHYRPDSAGYLVAVLVRGQNICGSLH